VTDLGKALLAQGMIPLFIDHELKACPDIPGGIRAGGLGLRQVAALIAACDLLIGPDSGLIHLAAAVGKPILGFFNEIDPDLRLRYYCDAHAFYNPAACEHMPCGYRHCQGPCLDEISPALVAARAKEILNARA